MAHRRFSKQPLTQSIQQTASHPWLEKLARLGLAARGIVHLSNRALMN